MQALTISIVNYNAGDYLLKCLQSIEEVKGEAQISVVVLDNASSDGSIEKAKQKYTDVKFIETGANLGFGKAHNLLLKKLQTEYVLILNPDTELEKGVLTKTLGYMEENPDVGMLTCKVILPDGTVDLTAHRGLPTPWASFLYYAFKNDSLYHLTGRNTQEPHEVDAISGSFMLTRKSVLDKVGVFDEDYFMFAEDIDLSFRIKEAGYKVIYFPGAQILHHKGVSTGLKKHSQSVSSASVETKKRSLDNFYSTMKVFYKKHLEEKYPFFVNWFVYLGINVKWFLAKRSLTV
ncbi:MAG: glycosyltransferase family 2 protein [bacterium]|nr:glycosyltransferase family 2 protein [bacterium]